MRREAENVLSYSLDDIPHKTETESIHFSRGRVAS